ncbi:MAG TPA: hypothetical protein VG870_09930 [Chitinophagaceae bacterium]|nr:hypothetical protein [Chitinophagaceae bacterium]
MGTLWLVLGGGMLTLLVAAIGNRSREVCSDYRVTIRNGHTEPFLDAPAIVRLLVSATGGPVKGQLVSAIPLRKLEGLLKTHVYIEDAQLYIDNRNVLNVSVTEREPIARLFTTSGSSFYLDSGMHRLPLSAQVSLRLPVFTGFPDRKVLTGADSLLLTRVKGLAQYILAHPFWMAQVDQVNIGQDGQFEMVPLVGNHLVRLGDGSDPQDKFHRLYVFYRTIVARTGFDRYSVIDVGFDGQIVATNRGLRPSRVDTSQMRLNVEKLIRQSQEMPNDTLAEARAGFHQPGRSGDPEDSTEMPETSQAIVPNTTRPNPLKEPRKSQPLKTTPTRPAPEKPVRVPKAVMPRRTT